MSKKNPDPAGWLDRPTPQRIESERALLGGLIQDPAWLSTVVQRLEPEDFWHPPHGSLFRLLLAMQARGDAIDLVTVTSAMVGADDAYGGLAYVAQLPEHAPSTANLAHYADAVVEAAQRRALIRVAVSTVNEAHEQQRPAAELAQEFLVQLAELAARGRRVRHSATLEELEEGLEQQWEDERNGVVPPPLSSGYAELDLLLDGGFQPGDFVVVAGQTGMGKSAFAMGMAQRWAALGRTVEYRALEMPKRWSSTARALASATGYSIRDVRRGGADPDLLRQVARQRRTLILNDQPRPTLAQVEIEARRLYAAGGVAAVVIDGFNLMTHPKERGESKSDAMGRTSKGLKQLAMELGIVIVGLCQFNRAIDYREVPAAQGERWYEQVPLPEIADIRDCGELEHDSDAILFPVNAARYGLTGLLASYGAIVVAKNRNGPMGAIVPCRWDGRSASYRPMETGAPVLRAVDDDR
jgi:replicative DNA helicase